MTNPSRFVPLLLALSASLFLAGCLGEDGEDGATGPAGADAPAYTAGTGITIASDVISADVGTGSTQVASGDHVHDNRYYTGLEVDALVPTQLNDLTDVALASPAEDNLLAYDAVAGAWTNQTYDEANLAHKDHTHANYVNDTGDTMTGPLSVNNAVAADSFTYNTPRQHVYTVPSQAFVPDRNADYYNSTNVGAFRPSGSGWLVASVNLPHGATITGMTVHFHDTSSADVDVGLMRSSLTSNALDVEYVCSDSYTGFYSRARTFTYLVDNTQYAWSVGAYSEYWSSDLAIKGVTITYTTPGPQ